MEKQGLLFIPDISGFTRFVTGMEIEHSRHIIQELLEVLIDANQLDLQVSEVEGDAILFYRFGAAPTIDELYAQTERMFCDFHRHLLTYEHRRLCQCKACTSAIDLTLKVITHYGEFTGYTVKHFSKLIGKDVIVAHQLLKNDIPQHEYWLVTEGLLREPTPEMPAGGVAWSAGSKRTEEGEIPFRYTPLGPLKAGIMPEPDPPWEPEGKVKVLSVSREYPVDNKVLFYTAGHLEFRAQWQEGLRAIDEVDHFLPGLGTRHRCVMDDGSEVLMCTSGFAYDPDTRIVYSETDVERTRSTYFLFERISEGRSRFTIEVHLKRSLWRLLRFKWWDARKLEARLQRSLQNLDGLLSTVELPVEF